MRKLLTTLGAIALVVGGFIAVMWDVPTWRLYDRDWRPIAMTEAENWCAGKLLGERNDNVQDPAYMTACIADSKKDNITPSVPNSLRWGCEGLQSVVPDFPVEDCLAALEDYQLWWLKDGGFTAKWAESGSNKRPIVANTSIVDAPPRGEREDSGRELP